MEAQGDRLDFISTNFRHTLESVSRAFNISGVNKIWSYKIGRDHPGTQKTGYTESEVRALKGRSLTMLLLTVDFFFLT